MTAPGSVLAAVMVLVASATLFLPLLALRWTNGYRWPELTALGIIGAATGWFVAVAISETTAVIIVLASAILGAVVFGCAGVLANGHRDTDARRGKSASKRRAR